MWAGPCLAGVAVTRNDPPLTAGRSSDCQGARATAIAAEAFDGLTSRDHPVRHGEVASSRLIQVVEVVIVTEQDRIEVADLRRIDRRILRLLEHVGTRSKFRAGCIERRIGEQTQPRDLDERGGSADVGETKRAATCRHADTASLIRESWRR